MMKVNRIEGKFLSDDGTEVSFSLTKNYSWQQWGARSEVLSSTCPLVDALMDAAYEFLADDNDNEECPDCGHDERTGNACDNCGHVFNQEHTCETYPCAVCGSGSDDNPASRTVQP